MVGLINTKEYMEYALTLNQTELEQRHRLMEFLPETVIDAHAHCNLQEHVGELDLGVMGHMMSTYPYFSLEESQLVKEILFPGKHVRTLRFANAYRGIDHRATNEYLLKNSPSNDRVALYGIPDDIEYTTCMLHEKNVAGLKMYYQYFSPPAFEIYQVFPREVLEVAQERGIPIILHLPKQIVVSINDLKQLLHDFPRLTVVLAHLGLPHLPVPGLMAAYEEISQYAGVYMDTAMIPSAEVTFMAIKAFGASRILFGSDEPLNMIRSKVFHHPEKGERLITEHPYHWVVADDHRRFKHLAEGVTQTHWQVLSAIQQAVSQLPKAAQTRAIEAIFSSNAKMVFGF